MGVFFSSLGDFVSNVGFESLDGSLDFFEEDLVVVGDVGGHLGQSVEDWVHSFHGSDFSDVWDHFGDVGGQLYERFSSVGDLVHQSVDFWESF